MAQYNSKYTGAQIDSAVARALAGGAIDKSIEQSNSEIEKRAPAIESADYPGCYYRTVNGVTEWLNPPMNLGVEYRTTERYLGKPVYVKLVDCGALPNSASKSISISDDTTIRCFDIVTGTNSSGMVLPTPCFGGLNLNREVAITANTKSIYIVTNFDGSSYTKTYVLVKYYKTTD